MRRISSIISAEYAEKVHTPTLRLASFTWNSADLIKLLAEVRYSQGILVGHTQVLSSKLRQAAVLNTLTSDVLKSSEIEGVNLDADQVRTALARQLNIRVSLIKTTDHNIESIVQMVIDATERYDKSLTVERLFGWNAALFPSGHNGICKIKVGQWRDDRDGPMQIVSGSIGKEHIHFEAPSARQIKTEMKAFLNWFKADSDIDLVLKLP